MRFLTIYKAPWNGGQGVKLSPEQVAAVNQSIADAKKQGKLVDAIGLHPVAEGAQVAISGEELSVIDGPFIESKELIGGFAIFEFASKQEAIESAKEFLRVMGAGEVEIRQVMDNPAT